MNDSPVVSVIIPHYLGDVLLSCLESLYDRTQDVEFEVIVADDQPYEDGSLSRAVERFPGIRVVRTSSGPRRSLGLGVGCNRGLEIARGRYAMLLNNDVEVCEGWCEPLIEALESDETVGACQPKVLSLRDRETFDYGGAAGGLMDGLGFTYCLGRVFDTVERDRHQYDEPRDIFWAVGGACFLRVDVAREVGLLDEAYYMHMEEIDLCWRLQLAGFRIRSVPSSVVYHYGGWSLKSESFRKAYLNHRNQLAMLLKNLSLLRLAWVLPLRILLTLGTLPLGVIKQDWKQPAAFLGGLAWICVRPLHIIERRAEAQRARRISDKILATRMHPGSIALQYFLRGKKTATELLQTGPGG